MDSSIRVTVVIDAFRAFSTASYVLESNPASYRVATKSSVISRLAIDSINPLLIGKPEKGFDHVVYHIPNSPTRVLGVKITGSDVLHRTEAGIKGILQSQDADIILAAGFVNAESTVQYINKTIRKKGIPKITIIPMGHQGETSSLEDDICADYIKCLLREEKFDINLYMDEIRQGPGSYFFSQDQWQYPSEDFTRCLEMGRFNFAIQAILKDDYAILSRCE